MLSVSIDAPRAASLVEMPEPTATPGWATVDVTVAPLCTEFARYTGGTGGAALGHEAVGTVREVTAGSRLRVSQRVIAMPLLGCGACPLCLSGDYIHCPLGIPGEEPLGTLREVIRKPERLLVPVPDNISDADASLACCALGASFGAFERAHVSGADQVLVTGLGPVGLGAVAHGVMRGCRVIAVDTNPFRRQLARTLGADIAFDAVGDVAAHVRDSTGGAGADFAIDCSGAVSAQRLCLEGVRRLGQVAFVGNSFGDTPLRVSSDLIFAGLTVFGSWHYNLSAAPRLLRLIGRHRDLVRRLVTHRFALSEIDTAWETQLGGACGKVLIDMVHA